MIAIMLGSLLVAGSVVVGQNDPCLAVERGDGSTISLCAEFEIERLHDPRVTASAVQMLNALGAAAVPSLLRALKSDENLVRVGAVDALGRIGGRSTPEERLGIARAVSELLGDSESRVRLQAVGAIARIGVDDPSTRRALEMGLADREPEVRKAAEGAVRALNKGGGGSVR